MRFGWPISLFLHMAVLIAGFISLAFTTKVDVDDKIIPVSLISIAEDTNIRAAIKAPKPKPIIDDKPMQLENPMPNAPEEGAPVEAAAEEEIPEETSEISPNDTAEIEVKPPEKIPEKPTFDLDKLDALIDKAKESQPEANQQQALLSENNFYEFASKSRAGIGEGSTLTMNEVDALRSAMYKCWRIPLDAKNPEELGVRVRVKLRADGSVSEAQLMDQTKIAVSPNPYMTIAAQRAVNAVSKCAPYDFLPPEKYSNWRDMTLYFQPEI